MKIAIDKIEIGPRLRDIVPSVVDTIAASFKSEGQLQPIIVQFYPGNDRVRLCAGAHRIAAAKQCGWIELEATPLQIAGMSLEMASVTGALAEVDENLARGEFDAALRASFLDERTILTAKRVALEKFEKEAAAHAAAPANSTEKRSAKDRKSRAAKSAQKTLPSRFPTGEQPTPEIARGVRLPNDVLDQVAKETGIPKQTIAMARSLANTVGRENLRVFAGTSLATKAELTAFAKLRKLNEKAADDCVQKAKFAKEKGFGKHHVPGSGGAFAVSPSGRLGELMKRDNAARRHEALKSREGTLTELRDGVQKASGVLQKVHPYFYKLPAEERSKLGDFKRAETALADVLKTLTQMVRGTQQKRTGQEHKYKDERPAQSKQEARDELKTHAKAIAKKVKAKAPKKKKSA